MSDSLKKKVSAKMKPKLSPGIVAKKAAFKAKYGRTPSTDSEIDEVYGAGSATKALDEVYEKMEKK